MSSMVLTTGVLACVLTLAADAQGGSDDPQRPKIDWRPYAAGLAEARETERPVLLFVWADG